MKINFPKFRIAISIILSVFCFSINSDASDAEISKNSIIGMWQTNLEDKGTEVIFILDIRSTETDSLECLMHFPDFGFSNIPYGKFLLNDNKFSLTGFEANYEKNEDKIAGLFSALGPELNVTFHKISEKPDMTIKCPEKEADWSFKTNGAIWSPPTRSNGNIIFGNDEGIMYSVKIADKSIDWEFHSHSPIRSKALISNGKVWFSSDNGYLHALDYKTGESKWKIYIGNNVSRRINPAKEGSSYDYLCSSPVASGGKIYVGSMDSSIYAIDAKNGSIIWQYKTEGMIRSTPVVENGSVYIGSWDHNLYALNSKDGSLLWKYDAGLSIQSSPVIVENKIIFGSRAAFIFALDKDSGEEIWKTRYWGSWVESTPVLYNGIIYIGSSDYRKLHALDPKDGKVIWDTRLEGWAWPTPAVTDKYVYSGSIGTLSYMDNMHGRFYAFDRKTGNPVWQIKAKDISDVFAYGFASSPTYSKGWVFFGGLDGNMYGVKEK